MYLEYWGLKKHPFDNVPDPEMYFDMHQSVDSAVSEILFAIEEGDDCLAVAVGPVGVGKTMCLRIVLDSLDHDKYRIAFVTNPDMTFTQLLREIVGQLEGKECDETRKDRLFERFNKVLFETSDQRKRVVIFIDEGNVIKPHNLDSLRLLTNMQDDHQNLFTIVLAGQMELARRLEDPRRANLFQRIGVYCKIEGIDTRETMIDYIEHRLERAGWDPSKKVFSEAAYEVMWKFSENGIPRLINKISKLALKAAETCGDKVVNEKVVSVIAERFMRTVKTQRKQAQLKAPPIEEIEKQQEIKNKETEAAGKIEKIAPPAPAQKKQPVLTEIKPPEPEIKVPASVPPVSEKVKDKAGFKIPEGIEKKTLKQLEEIASNLATEKIKAENNLSDPFEVWEKARSEILSVLLKVREERSVKVQGKDS